MLCGRAGFLVIVQSIKQEKYIGLVKIIPIVFRPLLVSLSCKLVYTHICYYKYINQKGKKQKYVCVCREIGNYSR